MAYRYEITFFLLFYVYIQKITALRYAMNRNVDHDLFQIRFCLQMSMNNFLTYWCQLKATTIPRN